MYSNGTLPLPPMLPLDGQLDALVLVIAKGLLPFEVPKEHPHLADAALGESVDVVVRQGRAGL